MKNLNQKEIQKLEFDYEEARSLFSSETLDAMKMSQINGGFANDKDMFSFLNDTSGQGYNHLQFAQYGWQNLLNIMSAKGIPTPIHYKINEVPFRKNDSPNNKTFTYSWWGNNQEYTITLSGSATNPVLLNGVPVR